MAGNVKIIPPRENEPTILRVAAYCRVSTDHAEQALSYASQIRNYTDLINDHEGWVLVDVYADEAVSGTKTDKREDFNRMLSDCRKGRIDKVLVKSLSRFSRNTKDCLAALRELMSLGVTIQFEKENIDTETLTTEFLVSVFGALAQQESVSISENGRQGFRRRMELGQFITTKPPYGYRLKGSGCLEIIRSEAELVRWVFDAYLSGHSVGWIVNDLISRGIQDRKGNVHWTTRQIYYWLSNEKYIGDTLCQKTYKTGFPLRRRSIMARWTRSTSRAPIPLSSAGRPLRRSKLSGRGKRSAGTALTASTRCPGKCTARLAERPSTGELPGRVPPPGAAGIT